MDESLKSVLPQKPQQVTLESEQTSPTDNNKKILFFVVFICFFIALSSFSFYVLYNKTIIDKSDMMIEHLEQDIEKVVESDVINTKKVAYGYWAFSIPENWDYLGCKSGDYVFIGEVNSGIFINSNTAIPTSHQIDCGFDYYVSEIVLSRNKELISPPRSSTPSTQSPYVSVSDVETINIAGKNAVIQYEDRKNSQGEGVYWSAYINYGEGSDVIQLSDMSKKDVFDTILNSLSYTSYQPTSTLRPSSVPQQTYADPDGYFSFTYPTTWKVRKTFGASVEKSAPVQTEISGIDLQYESEFAPSLVMVLHDMKGLSFFDWMNTYRPQQKDVTDYNTVHNGFNAYKKTYVSSQGYTTEEYYYIDNSYIVYLAYPLKTDHYNKEIQQIISSLKTFRL